MISQNVRLVLMKHNVTYDKANNLLNFCTTESVHLNPFTETDESFIDELNLLYRDRCIITDFDDTVATSEGKQALKSILADLTLLSDRIPKGTMFMSSWGYDASHNYWYEVVKSTEKSVWLRLVQNIYKDRGSMVYYSRPTLRPRDYKEIRKRVTISNGTPLVKISNYETARAVPMDTIDKWVEEFDD